MGLFLSIYNVLDTAAPPPQFIIAMKGILGDISSWMLYLVPAVIVIVLVLLGLKIAQANDGMELKETKKKAVQIIIGVAIAGGASWIANYIAGKFI